MSGAISFWGLPHLILFYLFSLTALTVTITSLPSFSYTNDQMLRSCPPPAARHCLRMSLCIVHCVSTTATIQGRTVSAYVAFVALTSSDPWIILA